MTPIVWKLCNLTAFSLDMVLNAVYGKNIKNMSDAYDHIGVPAGPAFGIWGIIFTWEMVFIIGQFFSGSDLDAILPALTPWFCLTQLMQGLWVPLFTRSDPSLVGAGGDIWFWLSTALLVATAPCFMMVVHALSTLSTGSSMYWLTFGITVNAAWVLLAAGLSVGMVPRAMGLEGTPLCAWAMTLLVATVCVELWVTGFVGTDPLRSPRAYLVVGIWALLWIFHSMKSYPAEVNDHVKRLLPLYGSSFVIFFKWSTMVVAVAFLVLQVLLLNRKSAAD